MSYKIIKILEQSKELKNNDNYNFYKSKLLNNKSKILYFINFLSLLIN